QLVVREDEDRFKSLEEARAQGLAIATLEGTAAEKLLNRLGMNTPAKYEEQQGPFSDLLAKRVDGVLMDVPIAIDYAAPDKSLKYSQYKPGLKFMGPPANKVFVPDLSEVPINAEGFYGIAVRKNDVELLDQINRALTRLQETGKLKEILQKWQV